MLSMSFRGHRKKSISAVVPSTSYNIYKKQTSLP